MVPVLMLAIDHSFLEKSSKLRFIFNNFGFTQEAVFLKTLIVIILLFFILKSLAAFLLLNYSRRCAAGIAKELSAKSYDRAFSKGIYASPNADNLSFEDAVVFTPYYFTSGIYLPFLTLLSESSIVFMLTLFFTIYKPVIFFLIVGLLGSGFFIVNRFTRKKIALLGEEGAFFRDQALRETGFKESGFNELLLYKVSDFFRDRMLIPFGKFANSGLKAVNLQHVPGRVNEFVALTGIIILVIYAYFFSSDNLGEVRVLAALFAIAVFRLMPAANRILNSLMHLKLNAYTVEKLRNINENNNSQSADPIVYNTAINLENISFSYCENKEVLRDVSLSIEKNTMVGIKGLTGSGKTTLLKIITGLEKPHNGKMYVDGIQINNQAEIQGLFAFAGQDPYLYDATIAENVAIGETLDTINLDKVKAALQLAAFWELQDDPEFIFRKAGENGAMLSEGQKQRISIARAIYSDRPVLVFDEPTSNLDEETEKKMILNLEILNKSGKTIVFVAHRDKLFDICKKIYSLESGNLKLIK